MVWFFMIDPTLNEQQAIVHSGNIGGQYLDSIRVTDLSRLTQIQYETYVRVLISAYQGEMQRLCAVRPQDNFPLPY